MEVSRKAFVLAIVLTAILSGSFAYAVKVNVGFHRDPQPRANVFYVFETARGTWTSKGGNIITNGGEQYVRNILGWNNVTNHNATQWIALGNSSILATRNKLGTEATTAGFGRAANDTCVAWMNGTDYAYNVSNKFTASATIQINATALHWSGTAEATDCFALASVTETTFNSGDNCTIVWVITWDAN